LIQSPNKTTSQIEEALVLAEKSVKVFPYFFNLYLVYTTANTLENEFIAEKYFNLLRVHCNSHDKFLYTGLMQELNISPFINIKSETKIEQSSYYFANEVFDFGVINKGTNRKFEFTCTNIGKDPLIIEQARHGCSCINLKWEKEPILPGEKGVIRGTYHANTEGFFYKQVYVHFKTKINSMAILIVKGEVKT